MLNSDSFWCALLIHHIATVTHLQAPSNGDFSEAEVHDDTSQIKTTFKRRVV